MSSFQIDDISRGFTYLKDTSLDMRMNQNSMLTAKDIVNTYEKDDLAQIFFKYGDEENGFKIANEIGIKATNSKDEIRKIVDVIYKLDENNLPQLV